MAAEQPAQISDGGLALDSCVALGTFNNKYGT